MLSCFLTPSFLSPPRLPPAPWHQTRSGRWMTFTMGHHESILKPALAKVIGNPPRLGEPCPLESSLIQLMDHGDASTWAPPRWAPPPCPIMDARNHSAPGARSAAAQPDTSSPEALKDAIRGGFSPSQSRVQFSSLRVSRASIHPFNSDPAHVYYVPALHQGTGRQLSKGRSRSCCRRLPVRKW